MEQKEPACEVTVQAGERTRATRYALALIIETNGDVRIEKEPAHWGDE